MLENELISSINIHFTAPSCPQLSRSRQCWRTRHCPLRPLQSPPLKQGSTFWLPYLGIRGLGQRSVVYNCFSIKLTFPDNNKLQKWGNMDPCLEVTDGGLNMAEVASWLSSQSLMSWGQGGGSTQPSSAISCSTSAPTTVFWGTAVVLSADNLSKINSVLISVNCNLWGAFCCILRTK